MFMCVPSFLCFSKHDTYARDYIKLKKCMHKFIPTSYAINSAYRCGYKCVFRVYSRSYFIIIKFTARTYLGCAWKYPLTHGKENTCIHCYESCMDVPRCYVIKAAWLLFSHLVVRRAITCDYVTIYFPSWVAGLSFPSRHFLDSISCLGICFFIFLNV